jgi:hypothetical protein
MQSWQRLHNCIGLAFCRPEVAHTSLVRLVVVDRVGIVSAPQAENIDVQIKLEAAEELLGNGRLMQPAG